MKDDKNSILAYGFILILLFVSACITCLAIKDTDKKIAALQQSNNELIQQNKELTDTLYVYDMNIKEYQSATDATIKILMEDVQEIKLEKEANESELHKEEEIKQTHLGTYQLTAYIATGNPCADGVYPTVNHTAACNDPNLWHKWVYIEGYGKYYIHDTGGMPSNKIIDLFVGSYDEAIQLGRRTAEVYLIEE